MLLKIVPVLLPAEVGGSVMVLSSSNSPRHKIITEEKRWTYTIRFGVSRFLMRAARKTLRKSMDRISVRQVPKSKKR